MSRKFTLIKTGFHDCCYNMGLDEALLESVAAGADPVLRFYGWNPPAVSIGYFQGLNEEVDLEECKKHGFDIVRRISGGGAVLHKSELTYSIIMKKDHPLAGNSPGESYHMLCSGIIEGLKTLGIESEFSGINDILVNGKKVSGNAQTRRLGCILQHGTILLDNDIETMFAVLKVPSEKLKGKLIEEVKERVTNLRAALGREVPFDEAIEAFSSGFAKAMDLEYVPSEPSPAEGRRAGELAAEKFASLQWLHRR